MLRRVQRCLVLLGMGAGALAFGPCNPTYANFTTMFQTVGDDVIKTASDNLFDIPTVQNGQLSTKGNSDFDRWVRLPLTTLAQAGWNNFVDSSVPQDPADALRSGALARK